MGSRKNVGPTPDPTLVVLGLGNPGDEYARTRHNFGFVVVDGIAREERLSFARGPGPVKVASFPSGPEHVLLAKPTTYMNRSGEAARALRAEYPRIPLERWLVVTDDLDLPLGKIRLRAGGGAGGHNGLKSLIEAFATNEFPRLRLGIGRPDGGDREDVVDWVLEPFTTQEAPLVPEIARRGAEAVRSFITWGIVEAMNRANVQSAPRPEGSGPA